VPAVGAVPSATQSLAVTGHDAELAVGETDENLVAQLVHDIERSGWADGEGPA